MKDFQITKMIVMSLINSLSQMFQNSQSNRNQMHHKFSDCKLKLQNQNEFKFNSQFINLQQLFRRNHLFTTKPLRLMGLSIQSLEMKQKCLMKMMNLIKYHSQSTCQAKYQQTRNAFYARKSWLKMKLRIILKYAQVWTKTRLNPNRFNKSKKILMRQVQMKRKIRMRMIVLLWRTRMKMIHRQSVNQKKMLFSKHLLRGRSRNSVLVMLLELKLLLQI